MIKKRRTKNRPFGQIKWIHEYQAEHPSGPQKPLQAEFEKKFGLALPQATLSDILRKPCPKDPSVPSSSESTADDISRGNILDGALRNYTDIDHATAVGPDPSAASDETSGFGALRQHTALPPTLYTDGLQDMQYQELQCEVDPTQSASMQSSHQNIPSAPRDLGLDLQETMYRDPNGSSYHTETMESALFAAERAGSLMGNYDQESAPSTRNLSSEPLDFDWWHKFSNQAAMPEDQPVDWNEIFSIVNPPAQDVASTPAQGGVSRESSAGQLQEITPLRDARSSTQVSWKGLPGTSVKRRGTRHPSQDRLSYERRRVQAGNSSDSGDISQSVDTLTSLFWAHEGTLQLFAEAEARRALKNTVKDNNIRLVPHSALTLAMKVCGYDYWKDQPPGVLSARRTGDVNQQVTEVEDSDIETDDGMDSDEDANSGEGMQ